MNTSVLQYNSGDIVAMLEKSQRTLVSQVSFSVRAGESLALIGETGSGKTMIAQAIMGLLPSNVPVQGQEIQFLGKPLPHGKRLRELLGTQIVYIPQNGLESLDPSRKIGKQLSDSLAKLGIPKQERQRIGVEKLTLAGLKNAEALLECYPFQLSGGMAQRVVIALAACSHAKLVIADEPTNGLDFEIRSEFQALLQRLFSDAARIVITHDIAIAESCNHALVLCKGKMMEKGPSTDVFASPKHPYTRTLMASLVKNGMQESPVLRQDQGVCPFYRRCADANDICRTERQFHKSGQTEWWCSKQ